MYSNIETEITSKIAYSKELGQFGYLLYYPYSVLSLEMSNNLKGMIRL